MMSADVIQNIGIGGVLLILSLREMFRFLLSKRNGNTKNQTLEKLQDIENLLNRIDVKLDNLSP